MKCKYFVKTVDVSFVLLLINTHAPTSSKIISSQTQ